jgi:hypothetical protein
MAPSKTNIPLTDGERQAVAEYIIRAQQAGRTEIPMSELDIALEAIRATFATLPVRVQRSAGR